METDTTAGAAQDYRDLREGARAVDLAHWCLLRLEGPDAGAFLQGMATQDLEGVPAESGTALPTLFLTEKGRPVALAWVSVAADGSSAIVIADDGARQTLRPHFEKFRIMEEVEFAGPEGMPRIVGIAGPQRAALLGTLAMSTPGAIAVDAAPLSFLIVPAGIPESALPAGGSESALPRFAGPAAFEAWRLAVGLPRSGIDFDLDRIATELDLPDAISSTKGCYVGQEVVARTSSRGQVRRRRVGFRFDWTGEPIPRGAEIASGGKVAGFVTSTAQEPGAREGFGMGYFSTEALEGAVSGMPPPAFEVLAAGARSGASLRVAPWPL